MTFLVCELLSFGLTDKSKSEDISVGIEKSEGRILFVIEEFQLEDLSVEIDSPTELIGFFFPERRLHQLDAFWVKG